MWTLKGGLRVMFGYVWVSSMSIAICPVVSWWLLSSSNVDETIRERFHLLS